MISENILNESPQEPLSPFCCYMREKYSFDEFLWDASVPALYYKGELIGDGGKRTIQVLGVLLRHPNKLVSHQQVLDDVWGEDNVNVTPDNVHQAISQLRKLLRSYNSEADYFKSKKGIGYSFVGEVSDVSEVDDAAARSARIAADLPTAKRRFPPRLAWVFIAGGVLVMLAVGAAWRYWSEPEAEIKRLISDSQSYESLVLYEDPAAFKETDLDKYWTSDLDSVANNDRSRIRSTLKLLLDRGYHYGPETRCDRMEFQWVKLNGDGDFAAVRTLEKWSTASYANDGRLLANRTIGPYFVDYSVRRVNGLWLIERSTTGRVIRPQPQIGTIEPISPPHGGEPFLVRLTGTDFQPDAIYLEIFGPGCPDSNPCAVPNPTLRETAALSDQVLDNVSLLLNSGTFRIVARNGDSTPSDPITLSVP